MDAKSKCHLVRYFSFSALLITEILNCIVLNSVVVHDYELVMNHLLKLFPETSDSFRQIST